jgi:hypothetical protein
VTEDRPVHWLKHAFAVDPQGAAEPNDDQRLIVDQLCAEVVRRRMTTPALLALEMGRPLNYVSAQLLHFFQPFLAIVADTAAYEQFASFLEQRGSAEYIARRLDALEVSDRESAKP